MKGIDPRFEKSVAFAGLRNSGWAHHFFKMKNNNQQENKLEEIAQLAGATMILSGVVGIKYDTVKHFKELRAQNPTQKTEIKAFTTQPSEGPYTNTVAKYVGWPLFGLSSAVFFGAVISHYFFKR